MHRFYSYASVDKNRKHTQHAPTTIGVRDLPLSPFQRAYYHTLHSVAFIPPEEDLLV